MSPTPAPEPSPPASELARTLVELRAVMADERRAIARLDLAALDEVTARKRAIVDALSGLRARDHRPSPAEAEAIHMARVELAASASLIGAASEAVTSLLGYEADDRYDRLARCHARTRPLRVVAY